jgi:hypothetical protein
VKGGQHALVFEELNNDGIADAKANGRNGATAKGLEQLVEAPTAEDGTQRSPLRSNPSNTRPV